MAPSESQTFNSSHFTEMEVSVLVKEFFKSANFNFYENASITVIPFSGLFWNSIPFFVTAPVFSIVFLLSIVGNLSVILVICRVPRMRTRMNVLLTNLSVSSIFLTTLCLPFFAVESFFETEWKFVDGWCKLFSFLYNLIATCSCDFYLKSSGYTYID